MSHTAVSPANTIARDTLGSTSTPPLGSLRQPPRNRSNKYERPHKREQKTAMEKPPHLETLVAEGNPDRVVVFKPLESEVDDGQRPVVLREVYGGQLINSLDVVAPLLYPKQLTALISSSLSPKRI